MTHGSDARPSTILLVEDEEPVRLVTRRILTRSGYEVLDTRNGVEALETLRSRQGAVDLVITDAVMPELSGLDVIGELSRQWPGVRVLLMSGYSGEDLALRGAVPAGTRFLHKPFSVEDLLSAVRGALAVAGTSDGRLLTSGGAAS